MACGSSFLVDLTDDILDIIGRSLSTTDICNVSMCCKRLNAPATFDQTWHTQCEKLGVLSSVDLAEWRRAMLSYKALCRFLNCVKPLLGIWVCQNLELGNVVYVMPGFASVVGCRVIPQKTGPLGIEGSPILWAPVFEVISDNNGAAAFILHGREKGQDGHYIYPGTMKSVDKTCNVLLLEVNPKVKKSNPFLLDEELDRKVSSSVTAPFSKLSFYDREKLLNIVTGDSGIQVSEQTCASLFPCMRGDEVRYLKDVAHLTERRAMLIKMHKLGESYIHWTTSHVQQFLPDRIELSENKDAELDNCLSSRDTDQTDVAQNKDVIDLFLSLGDTVGLTLRASNMDLSLYTEAWPCMDDELFALYKLPVHLPTVCQEYAGLWGGTVGWPPAKPGKALYFVNLTYYEEFRKKKLLATKILEGEDYVENPNGAIMFSVDLEEPSTEPLPWSSCIGVKQAFTGDGIVKGYGFRSYGSSPGTLFVLEDGRLVFIWKQAGSVLTLQRLDLEELLKKGERVRALPPIPNFSYLDTFYTNVFADLKTMEILGLL